MQNKNSYIKKIFSNLSHLVPYIGALFVIAGIIGLLFIQNPLQQSQDVRSDASETDLIQGIPTITTKLRTPFIINKNGEIALTLDSSDHLVKSVQLVFNIVNKDIDTPIVTVNAKSGFRAESLDIQQVDDGYLIKVVGVSNDLNLVVPPVDQSFLQISATSSKKGKIGIHFDQDNSYLSTSELDLLIKIPDLTTYDITDSSNDEPPEKEISGCNDVCSSNADCEIGMRCFATGDSQKCRLATNTSSTTCSPASSDDTQDQTVVRKCNEYCSSNSECANGLTCWEHFCRNPKNTQDNRCANPTAQQEAAIIQSCGETCADNADCAINLRCYQNECRLATNPSSTSCSAATQKTVSSIYEKKATKGSSAQEVEESDTPLKGSNIIPNTENPIEPVETTQPERKEYDNSYEADETLLGLIKNMAKDNSAKLPFLVILLGLILLVGSIILSLIVAIRKSNSKNAILKKYSTDKKIHVDAHPVQPGHAPFVTSAPSQNPVTQNLLKKLEEEQKNQ